MPPLTIIKSMIVLEYSSAIPTFVDIEIQNSKQRHRTVGHIVMVGTFCIFFQSLFQH